MYLCSFVEEIKTQNFYIYKINEVIIQTHKLQTFFPISEISCYLRKIRSHNAVYVMIQDYSLVVVSCCVWFCLLFDFHAFLCPLSVSYVLPSVFSPSSLHVYLLLYVSIVLSMLSPLCLPLVISPVLFALLSPHLLLIPSSMNLCIQAFVPHSFLVSLLCVIH